MVEIRRHELSTEAAEAMKAAHGLYLQGQADNNLSKPDFLLNLGNHLANFEKALPDNLLTDLGGLKKGDYTVVVGKMPSLDVPNADTKAPFIFGTAYLAAASMEPAVEARPDSPKYILAQQLLHDATVGQGPHQDAALFGMTKHYLIGMHFLGQGQNPAATRILDLTTTALYNPALAKALQYHTQVDIREQRPADCLDWSYFLEQPHKKNFRNFLSTIDGEYEFPAADAQSLVLARRGESVFFNNQPVLHGKASSDATLKALGQEAVSAAMDDSPNRNVVHHIFPFHQEANPLAAVRALALSAYRSRE